MVRNVCPRTPNEAKHSEATAALSLVFSCFLVILVYKIKLLFLLEEELIFSNNNTKLINCSSLNSHMVLWLSSSLCELKVNDHHGNDVMVGGVRVGVQVDN